MGYLDVPRVHVAGKFFTDPSTVNNDAFHFDPEETDRSPWQDAYGNHSFELQACTVVSAIDAAGYPQKGDALLQKSLACTNQPSFAKIVDLDTYQQSTTNIYGLQVALDLPDGSQITGDVETPTLNSVYFQRVLPQRSWSEDEGYGWGSYGGDANAAGVFITRIRFPADAWPTESGSDVLDAIRADTATETVTVADDDGTTEVTYVVVSFKFVLDGYSNVRPPGTPPEEGTTKSAEERAADNYLWHGRMVGSIGIWTDGQPKTIPGQRWLSARSLDDDAKWNVPYLADAPFRLDTTNNLLHVDLGGSLCMQYSGGVPVDLGTVTAKVRGRTIGTVPINNDLYENYAGIALVEVPSDLVELLKSEPVVLETDQDDLEGPTLWSEAEDGLDFAVEQRALRMTSPTGGGENMAQVDVYVTRFGFPCDDTPLQIYGQPVWSSTKGISMPPGRPGDTDSAEGAVDWLISDPENGWVTIMVNVLRDPGYRTKWLYSQLYFAQVYAEGEPVPDFQEDAPIQEKQISVVVFADYDVPDSPEWSDVEPLMAQYAALYPAMRERIDLTDEETFRIYTLNPPWDKQPHMDPTPVGGFSSGAIPYYLTRDEDGSTYMPITRDLTPNQMNTVLAYCRKLQDEFATDTERKS